jgi:predicted thioredoxin/glutaredoxin
MKIDCYISETCSSERQLRENLNAALEGSNLTPEIEFHRVSEDEAKRIGIMGSPSVLIDGKDILPGEIPGAS